MEINIKFNSFTKYNIAYGVSEKSDGVMKLTGFESDEIAKHNRTEFFKKHKIDNREVVSAGLVHSDNIVVVDHNDAGDIISETDGLVTNRKDLFLAVTVSDCLPIFFYDKINAVVGIAHAGWRGVLNKIAERQVCVMSDDFLSDPAELLVNIGPHIQKCHFEISSGDVEKYNEYQDNIITRDEKLFIDLSGILKSQLLQCGIKSSNIFISNECTFCNKNKYFSYRRDKPEYVEAMIAFIGMR